MTEGLTAPPILSSAAAGWHGMRLEHYRQPAHATVESTFPLHAIEVNLRYDAQEITANGQVYRHICPHNIGIWTAHQPLAIESYGEAEFIVLTLDPALITQAVGKPGASIDLRSQITGQDSLIAQIVLALHQELHVAGPDSRLYAESMATALASHLAHRYGITSHITERPKGGLSQRQLQSTIDYIQANLGQPLSLAEIAHVTQISPNYFATLFKQSTGISPYQYVKQSRIEQAQQLLAQSNLSISDIAHRVGFNSHSHFTKVFREALHTTPNAYRQNC